MARAEARFPGACRRFLLRLGELAGGAEAPASAAAHLAECASCAARLRAARQQVELLRRLDAPRPPAEVCSPAFLEEIHRRAGAALERRLGATLRAGLGPVRAPTDAVWLEARERADLEPALRRVLARTRSPGWMWQRIRSSVATAPPPPPAARRAGIGLAAAAALLVAALLVLYQPGAREEYQGTNSLIDVVFEDSATPFDASLSLAALAEIGR